MAIFPSVIGVSVNFQNSLNAQHLQVPIVNKTTPSFITIANTVLVQKQGNHIKTVLVDKKHNADVTIPRPNNSGATMYRRRVLGIALFRSKA